MRWLIRRVTRKGKGAVSYEEDIHYGDVLTIGRGSDQAIFIPDMRVALDHAKVTALGGGQYRVESLILAGIRVNSEIVHSATVSAGATLDIGTSRLSLLEPPADFDAGVEISAIDKAEMKAEKEAKAKPTMLTQTWLSKRRPAWLLFAVVAALFIAIPMLAHYSPGFSDTAAKVPGLPDRDSWQAGNLAASHHYFGSQCTLCHQKAFKWVRDEACARCHAATPAHADPVKFNLPELGDARCAHCHRDHNDTDGLVIKDQILCDECHDDLKAHTKNASPLADVSDFLDEHPEFYVNLPHWNAEGKFEPMRTSLATQGITEASGLKFPHDVHLDSAGINSPNGKKRLICASCHVPDAGGAIMKEVDYEPMCQECHRLDFDIREPERQVPHGKIAEIQYMLDEFYARRALEGGYGDAAAPPQVQTRRRPGVQLSRQEQIEALAWAREKSRRTGDNLFTGRACTVCHTVEPRPEGDERYYIAPVRVAGVWYAKSHFTHLKHETMKCADCHAANESTASSDLLIPGIANCRQCHGGEKAKNLVASTCIACHGYHDSKFLVLAELQARAKKAAASAPAPNGR